MAQIEEEQPKQQAASWMAAVAVQRLWRGMKGRKLGQASKDHNVTTAVLGDLVV